MSGLGPMMAGRQPSPKRRVSGQGRFAPAPAGWPGRLVIRRVFRRPAAWIGAFLVGLALVAAIGAPWLAPYPPNAIDLAGQLLPPGTTHLLGTDFYGRDMASRLLYGARATLSVALVALGISLLAGTVVGLIAGYSTGWLGQMWVALLDLLLAFPALLLALLIVALMGADLRSLAVAVGVAGIPGYARVVRSTVLTLRSAPYVDAARAIGASTFRILRRHLLPGVLAPAIAVGTLDFGRAVLYVSALGFLGLGASPPQAEWGLMLFEGRGYLAEAPWASVAPGLAITLTALGVTLLGDAVSDALAPGR